MEQLVFCASERFLTLQDEEFFHRNARERGEGGWVGYEGESLVVAAGPLIGDVCGGLGRIEGCRSRVVFALK